MKKSNYLSARPVLICLLSALWLSPAMAEETVCNGSLGAVTVDNLRVPQNATCRLTGTRVKGTITVQNNAALVARKVVVIGNVQAENARQVNVLAGSRVGGSVQLVQGGGAKVYDSFIDSDILFDSNNAYFRAARNNVGGNIQAFQNSGGVEISSNTINGNLQCKENFPEPIGGGNVVGGNKEDQCSGL
jgi:hypothetical protein